MWDLYKFQPSFVLGFHGCDKTVAERVLAGAGKQHLKKSTNPYDWLGNGIYFWESSPQRAMEWAKFVRDNPSVSSGKIEDPAVVGAIIDLGYCGMLHDRAFLEELREAHNLLIDALSSANVSVPANQGGPDKARRLLDCAVIEYLHTVREAQNLDKYDTIRSVFSEGGSLYPGTTFTEKSHIQLVVRDERCIRGYFRPIPD
ncbi:hypothetical protein ACS5PN_17085 [Roseateles sp. NT4]|uniref:hypothetical protein n=1 Tax=Roseateles sp. NT4 TaxID=3453715 RepID=UPI003EF040D1